MAGFDTPDANNEQELRDRIRAGSRNIGDYRDLADLLVASGRSEEAVSLYREVLNSPLTDLEKAEVSVELGWILYEIRGPEAEARTLAEDAIHLVTNQPESPQVLFVRGESHGLLAYSVWRTDENLGVRAARQAVALLERVIAESPYPEQVAQARWGSARLLNLLGKHSMGIPLCEKALEHDLPDRDRLNCLITLSDSFLGANRPGEAEQALKQAFQYLAADKGALPRLHFQQGLILRAMGLPIEARKSLQQALKALETHPALQNDPSYLKVIHHNLGELYYETEEYGEAARAFRESLKHTLGDDPDYRRNTLLWLAHCYVGGQDYGKARDCYEEVLASPGATEEQKGVAREGLATLPPARKQRFH